MTANSEVLEAPHRPRQSVLRSAAKRLWESGHIFLIVTVVNAGIQALLILPKPIYGVNTALFVTLGIVSYCVLLGALTLIMGAALTSGKGPHTFRRALERMRPHLLRFLITTTLWVVVVIIALLFWTLPGFILLAITPYVILAAADGSDHPVRANFHAIRYRFGRYLSVLLVTIVMLGVMFLGATATTFFIDGAPAAFLTWLYLGFVGSWLITGWALLWRSAQMAQTPPGT